MQHPNDSTAAVGGFASRYAAELAAGLLRSEGIDAHVIVDDEGAEHPELSLVRGAAVWVARADADRARDLLRHVEDPDEATVAPIR